MKRFISQLFVLVSLVFVVASCLKAPFLTLNTPRSFTFTNKGGSQSITFTCNRDWSVSSSESWIQVSPSSGTASDGEVTVKITCAENTTYDARTATVTVKVEELSEVISISQDTGLGLLVSPTTFDLTNAAQTIEIEVQKNVEYSFSIDPDAREWITHTGTKGLTSEKLTFSIEANETYDDREGVIAFKQSGGPLFESVVINSQSRQFISRIATLSPFLTPRVSSRFAKRLAFTSNSPQVSCLRKAPSRLLSMSENSRHVTCGTFLTSGLISTSATSSLKYVAFLVRSSVIGIFHSPFSDNK